MQISCILILFGVFVATYAATRIPLIRVKSMRQRMMEKGTWNAYLKYKKEKLKEMEKNPRAIGDLPQSDYDDLIYVGLVQIGTPYQNFTIVPDTGSSNFWIPDSMCGFVPPVTCAPFCPWVLDQWPDLCLQVCQFSQCCQNKKEKPNPAFATKANACDNKNKYNSSLSSTWRQNGTAWSITYGTGSASGILGQDTINFAGIIVTSAVFGQATHIADFFADEPFDGILGLGFKQIAVDGVTPVVDYMIERNLLDKPIMGVWMKHDAIEGDIAGDLMLGGFDASKFTGSIYYTPITRQGYWEFEMQSIGANGQTVNAPGGSWKVISDTGTSLVVGPTGAIDTICTQLGGEFDPMMGLYSIDCDATGLPTVTFTVNGHDFPVSQINYIVNLGDEFGCVLGFEGFGGFSIDWILGEVFIREWYQIYDKTPGSVQIGFAKAVAN